MPAGRRGSTSVKTTLVAVMRTMTNPRANMGPLTASSLQPMLSSSPPRHARSWHGEGPEPRAHGATA